MSSLDPQRTVAELKELRRLTGDENGAWRVAWTDTWLQARAWLREKLDELGLETHMDAAGNVWSTLQGDSESELLIGGRWRDLVGELGDAPGGTPRADPDATHDLAVQVLGTHMHPPVTCCRLS